MKKTTTKQKGIDEQNINKNEGFFFFYEKSTQVQQPGT